MEDSRKASDYWALWLIVGIGLTGIIGGSLYLWHVIQNLA